MHSSPYYRKNQGIVFLSKDAILTNSMHYYDGFIDATIEMFSLEETGLHLATFHLPKLSKEGHTIVKLLCSSSESDTVQCDRLTTTNLADARLLGITVRGSERVLEDNENICTFVTPLSLFTNYKSLFCHPGALVNEKRVDMNEDDAVVNIPWDAWGPKFTRLIPGSCTCSATYGWKISMEDGIYDFNQVDIARDLQRFGAAHWQHRDRSLITTESTTFNHSKFIDEITTSLPYRFINLEIPEGSDVILGENMIFRVSEPCGRPCGGMTKIDCHRLFRLLKVLAYLLMTEMIRFTRLLTLDLGEDISKNDIPTDTDTLAADNQLNWRSQLN